MQIVCCAPGTREDFKSEGGNKFITFMFVELNRLFKSRGWEWELVPQWKQVVTSPTEGIQQHFSISHQV